MSIPGPRCGVCAVLDQIEPEQADALRAHLANPAWHWSDLASALYAESNGFISLSAYQLSWHGTGRCGAREVSREVSR